MKKVIVTSGPNTGVKGYIAIPATHFPFEKLPLELRQRVYKLLFPPRSKLSLDHVYYSNDYHMQNGRWCRRPSRATSMLRVNRAINAEAVEFLYRPPHFVSSSMSTLNAWLAKIGSCRQHLTRLTISKSGHNMVGECYELLADAVHLRFFEITLPSSLRASLDEHMEKHWEGLKHYLLAPGVNRKESLRRLDTVQFRIGPSQTGILNSEGDPMKEMTRERQEACKTKLRGKVLDHFIRKAIKLSGATNDPDPQRTALWVQRQLDAKIVCAKDDAHAVSSQRKQPTSVIVLDDD